MEYASSLDVKYLGVLSSDFVKVADRIKEASYVIRKQGSFSHPIFVMTRAISPLGALLINQGEQDNQWKYYAAYLDLFIQNNFIAPDKAVAFKEHYKDPDAYCCLLVVDDTFNNFLYIPYPEDEPSAIELP